jgi:NAD(P)-dependent dehydrogenase (short-subunit alcohol dehydrogenase family)
VEAAVQEALARRQADIPHNNAGGPTLRDGPVTEAPEAEFWRAIKLDLFGTFLCEPRLPYRRSSKPAAAPSSA